MLTQPFGTQNEPPLKKTKSQKSLKTLLEEVSHGDFNDFREYLSHNAIHALDLYGLAKEVNLSHLGQALQGTGVKILKLGGNRIDALGAKALGEQLYATQIHTLDLYINCLGPLGVEYLIESLSNTGVKALVLGFNQINDEGLKALADRLVMTQISSLSLCSNPHVGKLMRSLSLLQRAAQDTGLQSPRNAYTQKGMMYLFSKLPETKMRHINILDFGEKLPTRVFEDLAQSIEKSTLTHLAISMLTDNKHKEMLWDNILKNRRQLYFTPYFACALSLLQEKDKAKYFKKNTPFPTEENTLTFAGGILMQLPKNLLFSTLSHLPAMSYKTIKKYHEILESHHSKGILTLRK